MPNPSDSPPARERPILFNDAMVRAILDGSKTQTRRPVTLDVNTRPDAWTVHRVGALDYMTLKPFKGRFGAYFHSEKIDPGTLRVCPVVCTFGAPGDRRWVREAWALFDETPSVEYLNGQSRVVGHLPGGYGYRADLDRCGQVPVGSGGSVVFRTPHNGWQPSRYMPRAACRLWLEVTAVRVERVQAITEADARAEGIAPRRDPGSEGVWFPGATHPIKGVPKTFYGAREAFGSRWDAIYGAPKNGAPDLSWAANPWCWVVEFRRIKP